MNSTASVVRVHKLSHRYGAAWAIRDISFEIHRSGVVGLLGSNGAGKSTTMNILCGVLNQTEGDVFLEGIDLRARPEQAKRRLGFLPQNPPLHEDFTVDEYLTHCAHLRLVAPGDIPAAVRSAKERCGVAHYSRRLIRNLSGGYRQRVGIAQAILHQPKLVVLDEPTNGLDPNQIVEVRALIRDIAQERAVLVSTHILSEVQSTCRRVMMIANGRVVFADTIEAFNDYQKPRSILMRLGAAPPREHLLGLPGITAVEFVDPQTVRLGFEGPPEITERLVQACVAGGWRLQEIRVEKHSLESVFGQLSNQTGLTP